MNRIITEIVAVLVGVIFLGFVFVFISNNFNGSNLCVGEEPIGDGVIKGNNTYTGLIEKKWFYDVQIDENNLINSECKWKCKENYKKQENACLDINLI